jgi:cytochrome c
MSRGWRRALAVGLVGAPSAFASAAPAAAGKGPDAAALQRGEQVYARCAACHAIEGNRTGPQHCGLFGRRAGTAPGFDAYSKAMRDSRIVWNERSLDAFLQAPTQAVPGTAMGYAGVKDPRERADLIAWLRQATRPGVNCKLSR